MFIKFSLSLVGFFLLTFDPSGSFAQPIPEERVTWWKANAATCAAPDGFVFVGKDYGGGCGNEDDGDTNLFAGLLCAVGEPLGCETVKRAQDPMSGRWFRSPRRAQTNNLGRKNSFSPDMALGSQLYISTTSEVASLKQWLNWLDTSRACWIGEGDNCVRSPLIRFCTDDTENGCTARPADLGVFAATLKKLSVSPQNEDIRRLLHQASLNMPDIVWADSQINQEGFSQHLVAVEIFLLRRLGMEDQRMVGAAYALAQKQPKNPFFLYLSEGPTKKVADLTLSLCPSPATGVPVQRTQWAWERKDKEQAWRNSVLWDCVFMARLIGVGK
ncbi:MAG: hypothetical protein JSR29_04785 [Nitrospira sp.]|nr:hypothetical protein [Nitrospira sp.]